MRSSVNVIVDRRDFVACVVESEEHVWLGRSSRMASARSFFSLAFASPSAVQSLGLRNSMLPHLALKLPKVAEQISPWWRTSVVLVHAARSFGTPVI